MKLEARISVFLSGSQARVGEIANGRITTGYRPAVNQNGRPPVLCEARRSSLRSTKQSSAFVLVEQIDVEMFDLVSCATTVCRVIQIHSTVGSVVGPIRVRGLAVLEKF